MQGEMSS